MVEEHMKNELELERFEKNYLHSGFTWIVVFIIGLILGESRPVGGAALMIAAMLGFVLRRLRIEGEKTREVLRRR